MDKSADLVRREKYNSDEYEFFRQNGVPQMPNEESALNFDLQIIQEFCRKARKVHPTAATVVYLFQEMSSKGVDLVLVQLLLPADQELQIVQSPTTIRPVYWTRSRGWITGVFIISKKSIEDLPKEYISRINVDDCFKLLSSVVGFSSLA